ncbi:MAG TPA: hypothetical protein VF998_08515 [Candidatus Limnocylindria bacterium]
MSEVAADRPGRAPDANEQRSHHATVDVALEARVRRWLVEERAGQALLDESEVVEAGSRPAAAASLRVTLGGLLRVALLSGAEPDAERALRRAVLASAAELVLVLRTSDPRSFIERAAAIRDTRPDLVLALVSDREARPVLELIEALRLGCAHRTPAPRLIVAGEARTALRVRDAAAGIAVELLPDPRRPEGLSAFTHRARDFRRGTDPDLVLRDEALEELALLVASSGDDAIVVDVVGGSASVVRATPYGAVAGVHVAPLGAGIAADRTVERAGLDGVRRWIPWAIDAPTLLERVFNRARWPDAVPADASALALEIALAHEALTHVMREAGEAGITEPRRPASITVVTGVAAAFSDPAHTALVAVDGLASLHPTTLYRDTDEGLVAIGAIATRIRARGDDPLPTVGEALSSRLTPLAFVVPVTPARRSTLRVNGRDASDGRLVRGAFFVVPERGPVEVTATGTSLRARGDAGELGVIVDARGRPLWLPPRDAERIPTVSRWFAALDHAGRGGA